MCIFWSCYGLFLLLAGLLSSYIFVTYFLCQFSITLMVFVDQEFVATLLLFFQCLVLFWRNLLPVWNVLLNEVKEGNITLNVNNIPINFRLFNDLEKPFAIEPPDTPLVSTILNISNKPAYSSCTPSTYACKLSHPVLTAFFTFLTTFLRLLSGNVSMLWMFCVLSLGKC